MKTAVVSSGAHQYLVKYGQIIEVEKLEVKEGEKIELDCLLLTDGSKVEIGQPLLKTKIGAKVIKTEKGEKIRVGRFKAKSRYRRVKGHRQIKTTLKIVDSALKEEKTKPAPKKKSLKTAEK